MQVLEFDIARLLEHRLLTTDLIAPTILRLAATRRNWDNGQRDLAVRFRQTVSDSASDVTVRITWSLAALALDHEYPRARQDLSKLAISKNSNDITQLAALGVAFVIVALLLPGDRITKVVPIGQRGDFYLNGRRDEMIEVSGTLKGDLRQLFLKKRVQILRNPNLRRAHVAVSKFASATARLERVQ